MRSIVRWTIVLAVMMTLPGCGGCGGNSQKEMMKNALRRSATDEDEEEAAEKPAAPAGHAHTQRKPQR